MPALIIADSPFLNHASFAASGYAIRAANDVTRAQLAKARKVVVVWSRAARGTPALKAAARRAKAHGKERRRRRVRPLQNLAGCRRGRLGR
jgi:aspartokinase